MAEEASLAAGEVQVLSPPYDVHLEEVDLTYPEHGSGTSQAGTLQYQSPALPELHTSTSNYRRRCKRPLQLDRMEEGDEA